VVSWLCVGYARQRDTAKPSPKPARAHTHTHTHTRSLAASLCVCSHTDSQPRPAISRWEIRGAAAEKRLSVCEEVRGLVHLGMVTSPYPGRIKWKMKNLQRSVLGQHRQVFSLLEFYSLQGVLWGLLTLQTVYMQEKLHNTQGDR